MWNKSYFWLQVPCCRAVNQRPSIKPLILIETPQLHFSALTHREMTWITQPLDPGSDLFYILAWIHKMPLFRIGWDQKLFFDKILKEETLKDKWIQNSLVPLSNSVVHGGKTLSLSRRNKKGKVLIEASLYISLGVIKSLRL